MLPGSSVEPGQRVIIRMGRHRQIKARRGAYPSFVAPKVQRTGPHIPLYPTSYMRTVLGGILLEGPLRVTLNNTTLETAVTLRLYAGDSAVLSCSRALYYTSTHDDTTGQRSITVGATNFLLDRLTGRATKDYYDVASPPDAH